MKKLLNSWVFCGPKLSLSAKWLTEAYRRYNDQLLPVETTLKDGALNVRIGPHHAQVFVFSRGYPGWPDAEPLAANSAGRWWDFPPPPPHATHALVLFEPGERTVPLHALELACGFSAAVMSTLGAVGLHWPDGDVTHSGEYVESVYDSGVPKTALWCGVSRATRVEGRPGYVSLLSRGLRQLGLNELEIHVPEAEQEEGLTRILNGVEYVAKLGRNLEPGETVGYVETDERIPVELRPSPLDPTAEVCLIVPPAS